MQLDTESQELWLEQLSTEYKILQDKLDKIGAFRFTVKGWSVTILVAAVVAIAANRQVPPRVLLVLLIFVGLFAWLEYVQSHLSYQFGDRIIQLERDMQRVLRAGAASDSGPSEAAIRLGMTPRIAHHLRRSSAPWRFRRLQRALRWMFDVDKLFYVGQVLGIAAAYWLIHDRQPQITDTQPRVTIIDSERANRSTSVPASPQGDANGQARPTRARRSGS